VQKLVGEGHPKVVSFTYAAEAVGLQVTESVKSHKKTAELSPSGF
jgi:hypothetical protein